MAKIPHHPCMGGPLDGRRVAKYSDSMIRFYCQDDAGVTHYYRLIKVLSNDLEKMAIYYHYFGTDADAAEKMEPCLRPDPSMFKKRRRRPKRGDR